MGNNIEKPWAVYATWLGAIGIGKIINESSSAVWTQDSEGQQYLPECWADKAVRKFNSPIKAMAYFLVHQAGNYDKKEVVGYFLRNLHFS